MKSMKIAFVGIPILFLIVSALMLPVEVLRSGKAVAIMLLCCIVISYGIGIGEKQ